MQPSYNSIYRALVTNNIDTTNQGKIRVQCPQVAGAAEIRSAEPSNPGMPVPSVNTIVWIYFNGGDITKPVYFSNSVATPPSALILDWTTPALVTGYTQNGNSNGTVQYRVITELGEKKVEWRGGLNLTYASGVLANSGQPFTTTINALAQPASGLRSLSAACSATSSAQLSLKWDTNSSGTCMIVGTNTTTINPPWISLNGLYYFI